MNNHWGGYDNYRNTPPPNRAGNWQNGPGGYSAPVNPSAGELLSRFTPNKSAPQTFGIEGRIVETPRDITPDEVPMNGSLAVFPLKDLSVIYAKAWTDNGIVTTPYVPEQPIETKTSPNVAYIPEDFKSEIFSRLEKIEQALAGVISAKQTKASQKKSEETISG